jgi:two-component system, NarL family, response regulator DesR
LFLATSIASRRLRPREHEVLAAAASLDTAAEVAASLPLSESTVRKYLSAAIRKLGSRKEALERVRVG